MAASKPTAGHSKPLCGARRRQGEGTCHRPAGWGTPHTGSGPCKFHGGNTTNHKTAALEHQARALLAQRQITPTVDVIGDLLHASGEATLWLDTLRQLIDIKRLRYRADGGEQIRGEVVLYERALERQQKFLLDLAKLDLDARLVRVRELEAGRILDAVQAGMTAAGITPDTQREALGHAARQLRAEPGAGVRPAM